MYPLIYPEALDSNLIVKMMKIHHNNSCLDNDDGNDGGDGNDDDDERSKDIHSNLSTATKPSWMSTMEVKPLCGKFEYCLPLAASMGNSRVFLFLGSSLGNYNDVEITNLFQLVSNYMTSTSTTTDRFLVGVDTPHSLHKSSHVILLGLLWQIWRDVDRCFSPRSSRKLVRYEIFRWERSLYEVLVWKAFPHVL